MRFVNFYSRGEAATPIRVQNFVGRCLWACADFLRGNYVFGYVQIFCGTVCVFFSAEDGVVGLCLWASADFLRASLWVQNFVGPVFGCRLSSGQSLGFEHEMLLEALGLWARYRFRTQDVLICTYIEMHAFCELL